MRLDCYSEVKQLTEYLVSIPSVVRQSGEREAARAIYSWYAALPYFKSHPEHLLLQTTVNDDLERFNCVAMVRGTKGNSNKAVILLGHFDTVGVEDFHDLKKHAFSPASLPEKLRALNLSAEINADIDSGEYMFGRGALDMKSGVAGQMVLLKYYSEHPEELDGTLITLAECDEEDNSKGVISALKIFSLWKETYGLQYVAAINADYSTPENAEDKNRYLYLGTIGKLLPTFYCVGAATHVGDSFGGLDPNLLVAEITRRIDLNPLYCDKAQGEVALPPITLKQTDTKVGYTVQTALSAYVYFNYFALQLSPREVAENMRAAGAEAFDAVIENLNAQYKTFCELRGADYKPLPWKTRVYTWEALCEEITAQQGEAFTADLARFTALLNEKEPSLDLRDFNVRVMEYVWERWMADKSPAILVSYTSTYFAPIAVTGKTEAEQNLTAAVHSAAEAEGAHADGPLVIKYFYPYISDSSFLALGSDLEQLDALRRNTPAWGSKYTHPVADIAALNVPVANIAVFGKDGHKISERVQMKYSFETVPNLMKQTVQYLLG